MKDVFKVPIATALVAVCTMVFSTPSQAQAEDAGAEAAYQHELAAAEAPTSPRSAVRIDDEKCFDQIMTAPTAGPEKFVSYTAPPDGIGTTNLESMVSTFYGGDTDTGQAARMISSQQDDTDVDARAYGISPTKMAGSLGSYLPFNYCDQPAGLVPDGTTA